jgi:GH24 family phage-related lysozyme (muramidase)
MQLSEKGLEFLKEHESIKGFDPKTGLYMPYDDGYGFMTIGYGHKIQEKENFEKGLAEKQVNDLFRQDIRIAESAVRNYISAPINQNNFDALVSLTYNIGNGALKDSTIRQYINDPEFKNNAYKTSEAAWKAWNKSNGQISGGLANRRNDEWDLYESGIY